LLLCKETVSKKLPPNASQEQAKAGSVNTNDPATINIEKKALILNPRLFF
jgi:hypothetical protein